MTDDLVQPQNREQRRAAERRARRRRATGAAMVASAAALGTTSAFLAAGSTVAAANTPIVVSNTNDTGAGSLRAAITTAEGTAGPDTITFTGAGASGDINLASGQLPKITEALTITGPGASALSITGVGTERIFYLSTGGGGTFDATISGLTLTHDAGTVSGYGGAVLNEGAHLTLADDVITGNKADGRGGGVSSSTDTSMIVLDGTTVSDNEATGPGGGGVYLAANRAELDVLNSTVTGNTAASYAGGLYFYSGTGIFNVTNSTVSDNTATNNAGGGGWIGGQGGSATISDSTISGNTAEDYGGGFALYIDSVAISNSTVSGNHATTGSGGGLYFDDNAGAVTIDHSVISDNHADGYYGGGLWFDSPYAPVSVTNTTVSGNTALGGGGVFLYGEGGDDNGAAVTISNSTLSGNTASDGWGGGLYAGFSPSPVSLFNSTVSGNTASEEGGGINFNGYYGLNLVQTTITNNTASTFGGLYMGGYNIDEVQARHAANRQARAQGTDNMPPSKAAHHQEGGVSGQSVTKLPVNGETNATGTIIAGNTGTDVGSVSTIDSNHSLIGSLAVGTTLNDLGGTIVGEDPMLGPLADNGGPTQTHALLPGSPAINTSTDPVVPFTGNGFDQRGPDFLRTDVLSGLVDIGAYEVQTALPPAPPVPAAVIITPKFTG